MHQSSGITGVKVDLLQSDNVVTNVKKERLHTNYSAAKFHFKEMPDSLR